MRTVVADKSGRNCQKQTNDKHIFHTCVRYLEGQALMSMRRSGIVAVLVIGAVLARAYGPKNAFITWTSGNVARKIAPLNVVIFWFLIAAAIVVVAERSF